jgi:DNA adenine methylase
MTKKNVKPFLKWAGGKTQLITAIEKNLPISVINRKFVYIEPFVGSGAVLFWILNNFPRLEKAVVNDINEDLLGVPFGRAFCSNLFVRNEQKGFPLQSLTQSVA